MFDSTLNRMAAFAVRHEKPLSSIALGWFVLSCAATWIPLPEIPFFTDDNAWMGAGPCNAIWWGYLRPRILGLQAEADAENTTSA